MSTKSKPEPKATVLKGQDAENKILEYVKKMNRPYGAVDVAANLKGAVPKAATQKILVALSEKGELVQKMYGKTTFFVANQAKLDEVPREQIVALEVELKAMDEENKALMSEVKFGTGNLAKMKGTPTDTELNAKIVSVQLETSQIQARLEPLRSGDPPISGEDLESLQAEWEKWKAEWFRRRKVFTSLWNMATDSLPPQEAESLEEDLGIERDTPEHEEIERGTLCSAKSLKRKRLQF